MAAKLGFEAIEYVLKKALTKKGVRGIPTIPGKAYDMRMKQLVDEMANRMRKIGYDVNNVTEKQVKGLLNYAEAMEKQKLKKGLEGLGKKKDPLLKDSPEAIAKIKAENKAAAERLRKKKEAEELFTDERPPKDPDFASGGIARVGFAGGLLVNLYRGAKGLQHGTIHKKLYKEYLAKGMEKFKAYDKAMKDAFDVVNQKKLKIVENKMNEVNVHSDDYVDLIDEHIMLMDRETYKDIKRWKNTRPDLADKTRALHFPHWAKTRYGEDYQGVLNKRQALALKEQSDEINRMYPDKSDTDILVDEIDEMNKANIDEIIEGRKKNASGGIAGQLHLHRPGYKGGALVKLLNLLKGSGKKTYYRGEPLIKNLEEMKKLEEFLKENKLKNTIMPETFRGRWFTNKKDIADIYANPEPGLNIIKKVELTPKEIEFGRKLLKKSKTGMEIFGTNIVLPKKKVKDIKTDVIATIMSNIKKPFAKKAEGGLAKVLGV